MNVVIRDSSGALVARVIAPIVSVGRETSVNAGVNPL
jgi:hypothetical protein